MTCRTRSAFVFILMLFSLAATAAPVKADRVSLRASTITWSTYEFSTDAAGAYTGGFDGRTIVDRTFDTWVLENRYLKVTLLPEYGGRILSMIYKPTGHEQLYRTDVGVPYGMGKGHFFYNWLMVYGGVFPTLPTPEHGKAWQKPWAFKVVTETPEEVTVTMSFKDDFDFAAPKNFRGGATGIEAMYVITLKAGRAALDARVVLKNPGARALKYEYWTCATFAPGSDPKNPKATGGAQIVAPIEAYVTAEWSRGVARRDKSAGFGKYRFDAVRWFKNWDEMGIAYAAPDMGGGNFWGVINHDNGEGIFRVADNTITKGLKIWTWGFGTYTNQVDARKEPVEAQPYVELWAGVSDQFFSSATFPARSEISIPETYSPSVGLTYVTHASEHVLANVAVGESAVNVELFSMEPDKPMTVTLMRGDTQFYRGAIDPDARKGNRFSAPIPADSSGNQVRLVVKGVDGKELLTADAALK